RRVHPLIVATSWLLVRSVRVPPLGGFSPQHRLKAELQWEPRARDAEALRSGARDVTGPGRLIESPRGVRAHALRSAKPPRRGLTTILPFAPLLYFGSSFGSVWFGVKPSSARYFWFHALRISSFCRSESCVASVCSMSCEVWLYQRNNLAFSALSRSIVAIKSSLSFTSRAIAFFS